MPLMVGYATPSCGPYLGEKSATPVSRGLFATDAPCLPRPFDPHFNVVVSFIVTSRSAVALRRHCSTQFNIEMGGEGGARGGAHGS